MTLLRQIQQKVRRLTGNPSTNQLSTSDLNAYINTFVDFDFPASLKIWNLHDTYTFFTIANEDQYDFDVNKYQSVSQPVMIDGVMSMYSQSRAQFFSIYPEFSVLQTGPNGSGIAGPYAMILTNVPVVKRQVNVFAIDNTGTTWTMYDIPQPADNSVGDLVNSIDPYNTDGTVKSVGTVNYITGAISVTFPSIIPTTQTISAKSSGYLASRPASLLFFNNKIIMRPIPDTVYRVNFEVFVTPSAILDTDTAANDANLNQWWQYIAFGAAKKVCEDRMDMENLANILPMLKEQENLIMYRTATQQAQERTSSIYANQAGQAYGPYGYGAW